MLAHSRCCARAVLKHDAAVENSPDPALLEEALRRLPHGRDFRFLDALEQLEPGKSGTARYTVRGDEPFLAAHFPGRPMLPGVILVEAIAQLGGVVCQCDPAHAPLADLRLTAIRKAKILGAAVPGDGLRIHVTIEGRMAGLVQVTGNVHASTTPGQESLLASATVSLSGASPPSEV